MDCAYALCTVYGTLIREIHIGGYTYAGGSVCLIIRPYFYRP
jgi:hypothetical protein